MDNQNSIIEKAAQETWDHTAVNYDKDRERDPVYMSCIRQAIVAVVKSHTRSIALDAGCGTGMTTLPLAPHFNSIFALDFSLNSLKILKARLGSNVICSVQADIRNLPFPTEFFDTVLCANTLQHLRPGSSQKRAIAELMRVTKPGGQIVISVHHYSRGKQHRGWIKEGKPGQPGIDYIFRFLPEELVSLLPGASISSVRYYGLKRLPLIGERCQDFIARWFGPMLARWGFGHMLLAIINK